MSLRRLFFHSPKRYIVALALAAAVAAAVLAVRGADLLFYYVDAVSVGGAVVMFSGLLQLVHYLGVFDIFGYSFSMLKKQRRYRDFYEYSDAKREKRHCGEWYFMPFITVGVVLLIIGSILHIIVMR
ncbi:MAG TPA: DUF3899 domain-containing protein [Bacillota bacterium]|nr:DUF3899 domain-containing protein [Bacillota bacterium]HQC36320.1 DUF3899 domain-containing protein [Bacillota bacterium]